MATYRTSEIDSIYYYSCGSCHVYYNDGRDMFVIDDNHPLFAQSLSEIPERFTRVKTPCLFSQLPGVYITPFQDSLLRSSLDGFLQET